MKSFTPFSIEDLQISSAEEYTIQYKKSINQLEEFWSGIAEQFYWKKKWDEVLIFNWEEAKFE